MEAEASKLRGVDETYERSVRRGRYAAVELALRRNSILVAVELRARDVGCPTDVDKVDTPDKSSAQTLWHLIMTWFLLTCTQTR